MNNIVLNEFQKEFWKKEGKTCPLCGQKIIGYFIMTCTNMDCSNFNRFAIEKCFICKKPRFECYC